MPHPRVDFQGNWPDLLKTQVEALISQHDTPAGHALPTRRWIAQHNPTPTGPLYAVGRPSRNGRGALGPVVSASGSELLDKLRALLSSLH